MEDDYSWLCVVEDFKTVDENKAEDAHHSQSPFSSAGGNRNNQSLNIYDLVESIQGRVESENRNKVGADDGEYTADLDNSGGIDLSLLPQSQFEYSYTAFGGSSESSSSLAESKTSTHIIVDTHISTAEENYEHLYGSAPSIDFPPSFPPPPVPSAPSSSSPHYSSHYSPPSPSPSPSSVASLNVQLRHVPSADATDLVVLSDEDAVGYCEEDERCRRISSSALSRPHSHSRSSSPHYRN